MSIIIREEFKNLIPPLSKEEYELLEKSICNEGCREALVLWENILVDGHNRKEICDKHNIPYEITGIEFDNENDVKVWIIKNQLGRRNISSFVRAELALQLEPLLKEKAKERMLAGVANPTSTLTGGETRKVIASKANVSTGTIHKVKKILSEATPEQIQAVREEKKTINSIYKDIRQQEKRKEQAKEYKYNPLPEGLFDVIYADPPWKYDFAQTESRAIENQYPTMTLNDICRLEIPIASNAVLFLWATAPKLEEAFFVVSAWDFKYKTCAVWDKEKIGMGYWFRNQHELLLVGVRGNISPPIQESRISSVIKTPRTQHSKKPDVLYEIIEDMFPNRRYLELFARKKHSDKWTVWGNQVG